MSYDTLIVAGDAKHAQRLAWQLPSGQKKVLVIAPGALLAGHRFDTVIVTEFFEETVRNLPEKAAAYTDWFNSSVRCRLSKEGSIITL